MVADRAAKAGATVWEDTEAVEAIMVGGALRGARLAAKGDDGHSGRVTARYVVVADGANSRFGWSIGTSATGTTPRAWLSGAIGLHPATTNRGSTAGWTSEIRPATSCPATAGFSRWATGGSTSVSACCRRRQSGRPSTPLSCCRAFCRYAPASWGIQPGDVRRPGHRRPPPDGHVGRAPVGPTHLVVGDAGGTINPFNGEGIAYAYETGRLAAVVLAWPCAGNDPGSSGPTSNAFRPSTASTTRWPGPSCASSAGRRADEGRARSPGCTAGP